MTCSVSTVFKRLLLWPLYALLSVVALWLLWSLLAYRDIPVEVLETEDVAMALWHSLPAISYKPLCLS